MLKAVGIDQKKENFCYFFFFFLLFSQPSCQPASQPASIIALFPLAIAPVGHFSFLVIVLLLFFFFFFFPSFSFFPLLFQDMSDQLTKWDLGRARNFNDCCHRCSRLSRDFYRASPQHTQGDLRHLLLKHSPAQRGQPGQIQRLPQGHPSPYPSISRPTCLLPL